MILWRSVVFDHLKLMQADPLSDVLSLLKPQTIIAGGFDVCGDWSIAFEPHTGIKCYAVLSGACWLSIDGLPSAIRLESGACVLLPHGRRFRLTNDLALPPVEFRKLKAVDWKGGIATLNGGGDTLVLGGHFAFAGPQADMLSGTVRPVTHLRGDRDRDTLRWALDLMRQELLEGQPGGSLVTQHLAHLVLVQALRFYLADGAGHQVGWLFALAKPQLAAAIAAMHAEPGKRWTLSSLAKKAGMSRASFAQAFAETVGTSPIDYLTRWRMLLAGNRLTQGRQRVSEIAGTLGYTSETAFSTAFKRIMGCSPTGYARLVSINDTNGRWGPGSTA